MELSVRPGTGPSRTVSIGGGHSVVAMTGIVPVLASAYLKTYTFDNTFMMQYSP